MRKGVYPEGLKDVPLIVVTPLTGYIFANAFLSFMFNLIIATLILIPFCWVLTWKYLYENKVMFYSIIILMIYDMVKKKFVRCIINDEGVINRRMLGIFQIIELFTTIVTGVVTAFGRFLTFAFFMIMSLTRLDKSVYPSWVPLKDPGYSVYLAALKMHHYHNNPTTCVFANLLAGSLDNYNYPFKFLKDQLEEEKEKENDPNFEKEYPKLKESRERKAEYQRKKRVGNKLHLFYILRKNETLRTLRKP